MYENKYGYFEVICIYLWYLKNSNVENVFVSLLYNGSGFFLFLGSNFFWFKFFLDFWLFKECL